MGSSSLKKPLAKKPVLGAATEDKTGELPIPVKKPKLVPLNVMGEEEKTADLPPPSKIKKMLAGDNTPEKTSTSLSLDSCLVETKPEPTNIFNLSEKKAEAENTSQNAPKEITDLSSKTAKIQEELQKVSRFLVQENKKIIPILEKTADHSKKSAEILDQNFQELSDLKNLIEKVHGDYKNDFTELETKRAELVAETAQLEIVAETYHKTKTQYDTLSDEYSLLSLQKHELEQEISKLVVGGKDEVVGLQTQKVKCEAELAWIKFELNEYLAKKETKLIEETELLSKHTRLASEVADLELKHQEITVQYQEKFSTISNFQDQCDKYTKKIEDLKVLEAEEKEEYNRLLIQKKNCDQALAFINVELHEFAIKKESMQFEEADLDQRRASLNKEITHQEKKHFEMTSLIKSKAETLTTIQDECEKYGKKLADFKKQEIFEKNEISRLATEKAHCEHQVSLIKLELHEFSLRKEQKLNEEIELDKKRGILEQKISSCEVKHEDAAKRFREKNDALAITHEEWTALSKRVEQLKIAEINLKAQSAELQDKLSELKDATRFSEEKRTYYQTMINEAEESYKTKMELLEKDYRFKQATMELELKKMEEKGMTEVKARIDETQEAIHRFLNKNQDMLAEAIGDTVYVKGQYSLVKPESAPNFDVVKEEIKKVIGSYFHQSVHPNYKEKIMHKIYLAWALSASIIATASIVLWYFKK